MIDIDDFLVTVAVGCLCFWIVVGTIWGFGSLVGFW